MRNILLFLTQVISVSLIFVASFVLARYLSPDDYGDFSTAYSCVAIAYVVCLLGADITALKFISVAYSKNNLNDIKAYVTYVFATVMLMSAALYAAFFVIFAVAKYYLHVEKTHAVFIAAIFVPVMSMTYFLYKVLISLSSPILSNFIFKVLLNVSLFSLVIVAIRTVDVPSPGFTVVVYLAPWVLILVIFTILFIRKTSFASVPKSPIQTRNWLVPGITSMPYSMALMAIANLGVISAELFLDDEDAVGQYAAATWVSQVFNTLFVSLAFTLFLSRASVYVDRKEPRELRAIIYRHVGSMSVMSAIYMLVIVFFGRNILGLYRQSYVNAYNVLVLLSVMQVIVVICSLATPILNYQEKYFQTASLSILAVLLIVPLAYLLYQQFDIAGIAASLLVAVAATFVPQQVLLMRSVNRDIRARVPSGAL